MAVTSRSEAETILNYDYELDQWHYYSDVPKHNRKWDNLVEPTRRVVEPNGLISLLEGAIIGNVTISKKRKLTDEQRKTLSERLKRSRIDSTLKEHSTD